MWELPTWTYDKNVYPSLCFLISPDISFCSIICQIPAHYHCPVVSVHATTMCFPPPPQPPGSGYWVDALFFWLVQHTNLSHTCHRFSEQSLSHHSAGVNLSLTQILFSHPYIRRRFLTQMLDKFLSVKQPSSLSTKQDLIFPHWNKIIVGLTLVEDGRSETCSLVCCPGNGHQRRWWVHHQGTVPGGFTPQIYKRFHQMSAHHAHFWKSKEIVPGLLQNTGIKAIDLKKKTCNKIQQGSRTGLVMTSANI